jgi:anti-sigma factor RsiW
VTCREFADFLADYLSGELSPATQSQFEQHLSVCPNCVSYLTAYKLTVTLGKRAFEAEDDVVRRDVPEGLVQAILAARRRN